MLVKVSLLSLLAIASAAPQLGVIGPAFGGTSSQTLSIGPQVPIARAFTPAIGIDGVPAATLGAAVITQPRYRFTYQVNDQSTGDHKGHWETRDGDVVRGVYSLVDSDGTIRKVEYTADDHNGFNAIVTRKGHAIHPITHHKTITTVGAIAPLGAVNSLGALGQAGFAAPLATPLATGTVGLGPFGITGNGLDGFGNFATLG